MKQPERKPEANLQKPNFSVCFEPANSLIRINWQGQVSEDELKQGYASALEVLKKNPVQRILIDHSRRQLQQSSNPDAFFQAMFNEALKIIGNTVFLAMVVPPEEYFLTSETNLLARFGRAVNEYVIVERFIARPEAEAWLATVG